MDRMLNQEQSTPKPQLMIVYLVAVILIVVGLAVYFYSKSKKSGLPDYGASEPPAAAPIEATALGSEIYDKSSNPVKDALPGTVAPVPNPLEGAYRNPFQ